MIRRLTDFGIFVLVILFTMSCAREVYNITWNGVVANMETKLPVAHAQISTVCSFQQNIDETGEVQKYAISDEYGRFGFSFQKGFGFMVNTSAAGFLSGLDYKVVKRSSMNDTIFISPHPFNASLVVRVLNNDAFFSPREPYIRQTEIRTGGKVDRRSIGFWGYDFLNGTNTNILDSADVWVEVNQSNSQIVLKSNQKGGIFPVFKPEHSDFITQVTRAPASGYERQHVFTGTEAGFFVLCRNGTHVAKIIPHERICEISYNVDDRKVSERGIRFDYLFQPDLENRLFFPVSSSARTNRSPNASDTFLKNQSPESSAE